MNRYLSNRLPAIFAAASMTFGLTAFCAAQEKGPQQPWSLYKVHDMERPKPPVVEPAPALSEPIKPPSDAIVLFDGKDLSKWEADGKPGGEPTWKVEGGALIVAGRGGIHTKDKFGDVQFHAEWATPTPATGTSQGRGNSGIFMMSLYETQVLDNYKADTYSDGQAGAVYGQYPPLVNVCRPPGEWQTYDIIFHAPRFAADGKVQQRATVTVLHNGVLIQDHVEILGATSHVGYPKYAAHPLKQPLMLQDHGNPVKFRNIWIREL